MGIWGTSLVLSSLLHSFCTAQVPALALEEKNTLSRGEARKDWEVGGQERRPDRSLQTIWGLAELDNTGTAPGPMGRRGP